MGAQDARRLAQALTIMDKLLTNLQILEKIYSMCRGRFLSASEAHPERDHVNYIPIDIRALAVELRTNRHELFGRLYFHLDKKYQYQKSDGSFVHLFALSVGDKRHCINFPYLSAILSEHRSEYRRNLVSVSLSILSLIIALSALLLQLLGTSG